MKHLAADFRQRCHGYVVTSHKAQGWTADHVVVAAERFTSKGAYAACSRGLRSCIVHTADKARLIERLPEGNRRAALDALSEICPKSASIVNRVRATLHCFGATPRRASNSTIDGPDANCAPRLSRSIQERVVPIVRRTACASRVENCRSDVHRSSSGAEITIVAYYSNGIRRTTTIPQSWDRAKVLCMSGWFMGGYSAVRNSC